MRSSLSLLGLVALVSAAKTTTRYQIPETLRAFAVENCTMPAAFVIDGYKLYDDDVGTSSDAMSFTFKDVGTGIETFCARNSDSPRTNPSSHGAPRYACENPVVEFIDNYQNGLAVIERACPSVDAPKFEALGNVDMTKVKCNKQLSFTTCEGDEITGDFVSLEPAPPSPVQTTPEAPGPAGGLGALTGLLGARH